MGFPAGGVCRRATWFWSGGGGGGEGCSCGACGPCAAGLGGAGCDCAGGALGPGAPGRALSRIFFNSLRSSCGAFDVAIRSLSEILLVSGRLVSFLLVRRKLQVGELLLLHQILRVDQNHGTPVHQAFQPGGVDHQDDDRQVDDHRNPESFPLPRAREIVLQLNQQGGNIVHLEVSGFPAAGVVKIAARGGGRLRCWDGVSRRDFSD